ncbi:MAG TPA: bifunctional precorrin-2 dehydrogenase/sirohydrochlorin ferrochelatase [Syntrophomonadaceae bacterium]|nr:bifunctional precorrin-2 dehydrogenase/sirohydrochlorin ferrochelatase [Syntrophomonadaceae bacterium]
MHNNLFPVYLDINGRKSLVVGGGMVARRKIADLLECGCQVTVISLRADAMIVDWANEGRITWLQREFNNEDLQNVFLVFLATDNHRVNGRIADLCRDKGIMVNAVDDPVNCSFFVPSVLRRQSLAIAISTSGNSPLFARKLKEELGDVVTDAYGEFVEMLGQQRKLIQERITDIKERKRVFETLIDSDILELLKAGEKEKARERMEQCMSCLRD